MDNLTDYIIDKSINSTTIYDRLIQGAILTISFTNILSILIIMPLMFIDGRFHRNYRILRFHIFLGFFLISFGQFFNCLIQWNAFISVPHLDLGNWARTISGYGADLLRFVWIAIFLERAFATYFSLAYEQKKFTKVTLCLCTFIHSFATLLSVFKYYFQFPIGVMFGIEIAFGLIGFVSVILLSRFNRVLLKSDANFQLGEKYQLNENVRAIAFIRPLLLAGVSLMLLGTILTFITLNSGFRKYFVITDNFLYMIFVLYIYTGLIICIKRYVEGNKKLRQTFLTILTPCRRKQRNAINPEEIENPLNKNFPGQTEMDAHFKLLNEYWK